MGVVSCEVWNNLGLSCFYSGQYDIALGCFDKALLLADELNASDVWYNISRTAIALGDLVRLTACCYYIVCIVKELRNLHNCS